MTYTKGDFFGELALLTGGKRAASVIAGDGDSSAAPTKLLSLRSKDFKRLTKEKKTGAALKDQTSKYKGVDMETLLLSLPGLGGQ